jgi:Domain of Unknown Function (DUF1259)
MIMGDLVMLDSEINPVMAKMIANGLEITAVHNHLLRASPATFYMHVAGHGDAGPISSAGCDARPPVAGAAAPGRPPTTRGGLAPGPGFAVFLTASGPLPCRRDGDAPLPH